MAFIYDIIVVNTDPTCVNSVTQQYTATGCPQTVLVKIDVGSPALGPFDVYTGTTGTTAIYSAQTRVQMIAGVAVVLVDPSSPCITPTPSPTPTVTPSSQTPTPTPTPSITPSETATPTPTVTPTITPSSTPLVETAYLFIEPQSGSTNIGQYMFNNGYNFYGFTNSSGPTTSNPTQFNNDMNGYVSFTGWTGGVFPTVRTQMVPQVSGGFDAYGNSIEAYNFTTHEVPVNTVSNQAWYTWIIPTGATNNLIQYQIDVNSFGNPNSMTTLIMDSTIYTKTFNYTGSTIPTGVYRVYTTFADLSFYLDNGGNTIYFRGNSVI
jgi:hypothetical protein